jgi:hypothetical protein
LNSSQIIQDQIKKSKTCRGDVLCKYSDSILRLIQSGRTVPLKRNPLQETDDNSTAESSLTHSLTLVLPPSDQLQTGRHCSVSQLIRPNQTNEHVAEVWNGGARPNQTNEHAAEVWNGGARPNQTSGEVWNGGALPNQTSSEVWNGGARPNQTSGEFWSGGTLFYCDQDCFPQQQS